VKAAKVDAIDALRHAYPQALLAKAHSTEAGLARAAA
jgi:hypothetical protein